MAGGANLSRVLCPTCGHNRYPGSRLGGLARARNVSKEQVIAWGRKGGLARAKQREERGERFFPGSTKPATPMESAVPDPERAQIPGHSSGCDCLACWQLTKRK